MKTLPEGVVESALDSLSIEFSRQGDELVALCPGHEKVVGKQDHNPSWSINERTGIHFCFSCGYKGNLFTLLRDRGSERQATEMWAEYELHGRVGLRDEGRIEPPLSGHAGPLAASVVRTAKDLPETKILMHDEPPQWALTSRRITADGAREYKVRWNTAKEAWVLPLRWPDTLKLMGYQEKSETTRYFRNRPKDMKKSETLFGIDAVQDDTQVVVVESPLDAVLLADLGYPAVAICGGRVSDTQIRLLYELFDRSVFWLDNDAAGRRETERLAKLLPSRGVPHVLLTPSTDWKDPGDTPYRYIDKVLRDAGL